MNWNKIKSCLAAALVVASFSAQAEDTDVFYEMTPPNQKPNLLFVLDNAANFSANAATCTYLDGTSPSLNGTAGGIEQCAFYNAISSLPADDAGNIGVNIGFVAYNANAIRDIDDLNCGGSGATGGCLMVPLSADKNRLLNWIKTWRTEGGSGPGYMKANSEATAAAMQEAWAYYTGGTGLSGRNYGAVKPAPTCLKNFVVFIGNAFNQSGTPGDGDRVADALAAAPGVTAAQKVLLGGTYTNTCGTTTFSTSPSTHENKGLYADEWARYMYENNEIVSYTIGLIDKTSCKPEYPALLNNMAGVGGGLYFETDSYEKLKAILEEIGTQILAVSSAFASASLPVSVNTQGTYLNQVFIGMFRPGLHPRWGGNIKQYKFAAYAAPGGGWDLRLVDADENPAVNANTGFITQCARSYWTPDVADNDTYWNYPGSIVKGSCTDITKWADSPDGDVVEKGAAGYMLRKHGDPLTRTVYTCSGTCTGLSPLGTSTALDKWVRGADVKDEDADGNVTEMRPSAHGDVVHSRPVAVDYGGETGVVVYYGANDGMLHALNGNQTGANAGRQLWSFLAPEQTAKLQRIYDNTPLVPYPSTGVDSKPYFFDGAVVADQRGEAVWIYATQRRGGRMVYAFDVTAPSNPQLKWRVGCTDAGDCTDTAFANIGQTWSAPRIMTATGYNNGESPLMIMGGGYDTCEDAEPNTCSAPKGNRIYVVDARTGVVQKTFNTERSVAADVTIVENAITGHADYAYAADTGGNVYRITFGLEGSASWTITKIAALGCDTPVAGSCPAGVLNRKFLFKPEVVVTGSYNAVLVGSGDREHPLPTHLATNVNNYFFMVKDNPLDATWLSSETLNCSGEVLCLNSLWPISNSTDSTLTMEQLAQKKGWYMSLSDNEQVVTSAIVVFGDATFSTHIPTVPDPNSCTSSLGTARVYNVRYLTGAAVQPGAPYADVTGGGLSPSPVSGMVTVTNPSTGQPMTVPFIIGADAKSPLEGKLKTGSTGVAGSRERVYWYIEQ